MCPWRAEAGHYYYTNESYRDNQGRPQTRQVRQCAWRTRRAPSRTSSTTSRAGHPRRAARPAQEDRAVSDAGPRAVRRGDASGFVVEHYQIVLLDAAERSISRCARRWRRSAPSRFPATRTQPGNFTDLLGPHVQARAAAGVAADVQLRRDGLPGAGERIHREDGRNVSDSWWKVLGLVVLALIALAVFCTSKLVIGFVGSGSGPSRLARVAQSNQLRPSQPA